MDLGPFELGDALMRSGLHREALGAYTEAKARADALQPEERVFFNLALANAALRAGEPALAFGVCVDTVHDLVGTGLVVGNPLFHLLTGLAAHGAGEPAATVRDNLARALLGGGPAMFAGEDPAHLRGLQDVVMPPAALGRWEGFQGTTRYLMHGARGYLLELLTQRLGSAPPWG
jgi:hypothetical protein